MDYNQYFMETMKEFFLILVSDDNFWAALVSVALFILAGAVYRVVGKISEVIRYEKVHKKEVEGKLKTICIFHLKSLLKSLCKVFPEGNPQSAESIQLDRTTFTEIQHGSFIYYDIILKNLAVINVASFAKTIDFFHKYKLLLENLGGCMGELTLLGQEKSQQYYEVVENLQEAIRELS